MSCVTVCETQFIHISAATLVDGTPLTPQQLGLMGMEALETVVGYWEDALAAYQPRNGLYFMLNKFSNTKGIKIFSSDLYKSSNYLI